MRDEENVAAKDGYSPRPQLYRAIGVSLLVVFVPVFDGPRGLMGVLAGIAVVAWIDYGVVRFRAASLGRRAG